MKKYRLNILLIILAVGPLNMLNSATLKEQAENKIVALEGLMTQAETKGLDTEREALAVWVANEFIRFSDWDEANKGDNEREFGKYAPYKNDKVAMAAALPDFERQEVIDMLDLAISEITDVIDGKVIRRPVSKVDWTNITKGDDQLTCNDKPIFVYDYFSKSQGTATDNDSVYNDYLGNVDHSPKPLSNYFVDENLDIVAWRHNELKDHPSTRFGYTMLWHKGDPTWQTSIPEVDEGSTIFVTYDIDNPTMREVWEKTLTDVPVTLKDKKFIDLGYCLVNEPHWYSEAGHWTGNYGEMQSISSYTLAKFHTWLSLQYDGDVNALNNNWKTYYSTFEQIAWVVPVPSAYHGSEKWYDWCRFNMDRGTEWISFLHTTIKASDPNADTHVKVMTDVFAEEDRHHGIDLEAITELTTYIGDDAKARKRENQLTTAEDWENLYAYYWEELCVSYDFMESVAPEKIHVNSESHFISTSKWRDPEMKPAYVRNVYWLATVLGMDANLSWFWARDPDGSIEDRFATGAYNESSYAGSVAQQPRVVNEHAKVMMDMNAFSEEIMKLRRLEKPMRIFYSEASVIMKTTQMEESFSLYESLFFSGFPLGYATERIITNQTNSDWEGIIVYKTEYATDAQFNALQTYLDNGGTVIIDNGRSLSMNEYGATRTETLQASSGTLHNLGSNPTLSVVRNKAYSVLTSAGKMPKIQLAESNGLSQNTCMWRVAQDTDGDFLVNIFNLGKNSSTLSLSMEGGGALNTITNMLTGQSMDNNFSLASEGTLLLKINGEASGLDDQVSGSVTKLIAGRESLTIVGAAGKLVTAYNISGQRILSTRIKNNTATFNLSHGVVLVAVEGEGTLKAIIK